ncbi:hypothetical protein PAL_GLEAN10021880 [Pteropus alecto]|uniref:Uncharacterized protein n=1 Tax=Pteropus alecto TaxID=9402 RepID=L5KMT8_PTEAL|nr:hypothetical protein PAL_GLEAN10021880 [Pteropus alecto]
MCEAVFMGVYGQEAIRIGQHLGRTSLLNNTVIPNCASASWASRDHGGSQRVKGMEGALRKGSWTLRLDVQCISFFHALEPSVTPGSPGVDRDCGWIMTSVIGLPTEDMVDMNYGCEITSTSHHY